MQDTIRDPKNTRGSSPPFQELERWIEDGANGAHWVRILSPVSHHPTDPVKGFGQSAIDEAIISSNLDEQ